MNREHAAVLCKIAESWLIVAQRRTGGTPPNEAARAALTALVMEAPIEAVNYKTLMAFTRLGYGQVSAPHATASTARDTTDHATAHATTFGTPATSRAQWISTDQAAAALGLKTDSIRALLRRGKLTGRRRQEGWQVDARSVIEYRQHRRAA